jgi:hypothetical protein
MTLSPNGSRGDKLFSEFFSSPVSGRCGTAFQRFSVGDRRPEEYLQADGTLMFALVARWNRCDAGTFRLKRLA